MIYDHEFLEKLWTVHFEWGMGFLYREIVNTPSADIYLSDIPGEYYNFAVPSVSNPNELDLDTIEKQLLEVKQKPSFVLFSNHQTNGFVEFLVRNGYKSNGGDCWLVLDKPAYTNSKIDAEVTEVTSDLFEDYDSVLSKVFSDFPGNEKYMEICFKSIKGEIKSKYSDLVSKLYLIYENGKPAAGAGLFYSKKADIAYLHDAGTLPEFRGKGYQTALVKYRVNIALEQEISRIYTSVEPEGQSWSNCIKVGFNQTPWTVLMVKK